jgi:hypothetical protein
MVARLTGCPGMAHQDRPLPQISSVFAALSSPYPGLEILRKGLG